MKKDLMRDKLIKEIIMELLKYNKEERTELLKLMPQKEEKLINIDDK